MTKKSKTFEHLIIARLQNMDNTPDIDNLILEAVYFKSIIGRKLGDIINYGGTPMVVVIAGMDKKAVVDQINNYIAIQNKSLGIQKEFYDSDMGKGHMQVLVDILTDLDIKFSKK